MIDDVHWQAQAKLLRCRICESTDSCTDYEFMSYVSVGWPTCCGQTMVLFVEMPPLISQLGQN